MIRAKKRGTRWQGQYQFAGYWFPVKRGARLRTFGSIKAAREAAEKEYNSLRASKRTVASD